jgi:hypothetical protein
MNRGIRLVAGTFVLGVAVSGVAMASAAAPVSAEARQRIAALVAKSGGQVSYFPGPSGTVGVGVTMTNGKQMVLYATADGKVLFSGIAVDTVTGENLTRRDLAARVPKPDLSGMLKHARAARSVTVGEGGTEFFVFVDPNCPFCHKAFALFEGLAAEGGAFTVHYIPVGILGPRSENAAKGLLGEPEERQLARLEALMSGTAGPVSNDAIARGDKAHQSNLAIFRNLQLEAVPVTLIVSGEELSVRNGLPQIEELREAVAPRKVAAR